MRTVYIDIDRFEKRRDEGRVYPNIYYRFYNSQVAWSPDGVGFFWYDTLAKAKEQHG